MTALRVERHAKGPRVYVLGLRVHHGASGALGLAAAYRLRRRPRAGLLAAISVAAIVDDLHDFPFNPIERRRRNAH